MTNLTRLPNGNISLELTIPWSDVSQEFAKVLEATINDTELPGFRKGKAPRELVEGKLDHAKLYSRAIEGLLPLIYSEGIKEHSLKPILNPKVTLISGEENQDWKFSAITCEIPVVTLPVSYEDELKKLKTQEEDKLSPILAWLTEHCQVVIPDILVEQESDHRLSSLAENVTKLGMSIDSYLQTKKMTIEDLKSQSATQARTDLTVEFILEQIRQAKSLKTRKETLDFLLGLV